MNFLKKDQEAFEAAIPNVLAEALKERNSVKNAEVAIRFGILAVMEVFSVPHFLQWAKQWLAGSDRSHESALVTCRLAEAAGKKALDAQENNVEANKRLSEWAEGKFTYEIPSREEWIDAIEGGKLTAEGPAKAAVLVTEAAMLAVESSTRPRPLNEEKAIESAYQALAMAATARRHALRRGNYFDQINWLKKKAGEACGLGRFWPEAAKMKELFLVTDEARAAGDYRTANIAAGLVLSEIFQEKKEEWQGKVSFSIETQKEFFECVEDSYYDKLSIKVTFDGEEDEWEELIPLPLLTWGAFSALMSWKGGIPIPRVLKEKDYSWDEDDGDEEVEASVYCPYVFGQDEQELSAKFINVGDDRYRIFPGQARFG